MEGRPKQFIFTLSTDTKNFVGEWSDPREMAVPVRFGESTEADTVRVRATAIDVVSYFLCCDLVVRSDKGERGVFQCCSYARVCQRDRCSAAGSTELLGDKGG